MQEMQEFLSFLTTYIRSRILNFGQFFEKNKDLIVAFLIVKRGKYSTSFLNTSFFILVATTMIAGPTIAENNPFIQSFNQGGADFKAADLSYNPYNGVLSTEESDKHRDEIIEHEVKAGDTLESIARQFGISVDTIKWASNIKTDIIKPGQKLQIPPVSGAVHKVAVGDNIYSIAKKYKVDPQNIVNFEFNDFADLETFSLTPGQLVYVPDGVIEEEKPKFAPSKQNRAQIQAGIKGSSNFIWPTSGSISQNPVWYHMALDIANSAMPPVLASDTGTVISAGCVKYGYGCHIIIDHANEYKTLYAHLSKIEVSEGQSVSQGQQIGMMGSTGRSTGTHLHFEVRINGKLTNPLNFLK